MSRRLLFAMNWLAMEDLPQGAAGDSSARLEAIHEAGYQGVQFIAPLTPEQNRVSASLDLWRCSSGRINSPADALPLARRFADEGQQCATLHVGWGMEDDAGAHALIGAILEASAITGVPLYAETHRATIFQDIWRSVQFTRKFPELRFNGDFSHWYTGLEMVYGGFEHKLAFISPVVERVRFVHGRIGNPGCIQVALPKPGDPEPQYIGHFRAMWAAVGRACPDETTLPFVPELLSPAIYYGRTLEGGEESGRWADSLRLCRIASESFGF